MVVAEELQDDQEYEDIVADIREECTKYGVVLSLRVPRPNYHPGGGVAMVPPGVGEVYVEFADPSGALQGANALRNRQFSNRTVLCSFFNEHAYAMNNLG
jgi:splicing factor U2AF subunit